MKIAISEYQTNWKTLFNREKEKISDLIGFLNPVIVHIGSTSVPGLCAKPVIDIQAGVQSLSELNETILPMQRQYTYVKMFEPEWPSRRFYCKFKSDTGKPIPSVIDINEPMPIKQGLISSVNIHIFVKDTDDWIRHIAFRDYLESHREERDAYCLLKKQIAKRDFDTGMDYNNAKNNFVKQTQQKALEWYRKIGKID